MQQSRKQESGLLIASMSLYDDTVVPVGSLCFSNDDGMNLTGRID